MLLLRLLWNVVWRSKVTGHGSFACPKCREIKGCSLVRYDRWIQILAAPVIRRPDHYERIRCDACASEFEDMAVTSLALDPA